MANKRKVYIETSIVSYLVARPSRDLVRAARQELTIEFWEKHRHEFDLFVSQLVTSEAAKGDPNAAASRLSLIADIPRLEETEAVASISSVLMARRILPRNALDDATHIAFASAHGMDVLLTWNCAHIANYEIMIRVRAAVEALGYACPALCTPEEMIGEES